MHSLLFSYVRHILTPDKKKVYLWGTEFLFCLKEQQCSDLIACYSIHAYYIYIYIYIYVSRKRAKVMHVNTERLSIGEVIWLFPDISNFFLHFGTVVNTSWTWCFLFTHPAVTSYSVWTLPAPDRNIQLPFLLFAPLCLLQQATFTLAVSKNHPPIHRYVVVTQRFPLALCYVYSYTAVSWQGISALIQLHSKWLEPLV